MTVPIARMHKVSNQRGGVDQDGLHSQHVVTSRQGLRGKVYVSLSEGRHAVVSLGT